MQDFQLLYYKEIFTKKATLTILVAVLFPPDILLFLCGLCVLCGDSTQPLF